MKKLLLLFLITCSVVSFTPKKTTWVAIGDSITYLNDHQNETGNRITKGYMTRVVEKLPYIAYTNQGHNGWTAVKIAENIEKLGLVKADVYSVFLGTNDWWHGSRLGTLSDYQNNTGTGTLFGSFRAIIGKLRSLNEDAKIILITPMQRSDFVYINNPKNNAWGSYREKEGQTLASFAEAVISIGKLENFPVIDLFHEKKLSVEKLVRFKRLKDPVTHAYRDYPYPQYTGISFNPETDEYPYPVDAINVTYDGLHPSDKGYGIIAKMLVRELKRH